MKKLLSKIGGFSLGPLVGAMIGLITVPVITRYISPDEYGRASMFTLAQGLLSMLVYMGMDQAYAREYAVGKGRENRLVVNAMVMPMGISVAMAAVIIVLRGWVSQILFDSPDEQLAVCLMAVMFPFMVVEHFALMKVRMEERGLQYSLFSISLKVFTLALSIGLLFFFEKSFRSVVYATALAEIFNGTALFFVAFRRVTFSAQSLDRKVLGQMLRYGLPLVPASLLSWLLSSTDKVMLRTMCDYSELGLYSAAFKIVSILSIVQTCFTTLWVPIAYRWYESGKKDEHFGLVMKLLAALMSGMCFGVLLCKDILAWILGESFAQAIAIFPFLMLYPIMYTMSETTTLGIAFSRRTGYNVLISMLSGTVNIGLNFWLIPIFGGKGAAMATGISYIIFFWARTMISRRLWWKFPVWFYVLDTVLILINSIMHTFMTGILPYVVSLISVVLVLAGVLPLVKKAMSALRSV